MNYILVLSTINDIDSAKQISKHLIENKLAACINIVPNITSIYRWNGEAAEDSEYLMLIKTAEDKFETIKNEITKLHPYEVPEIISIKIENGAEPYINWLKNSL